MNEIKVSSPECFYFINHNMNLYLAQIVLHLVGICFRTDKKLCYIVIDLLFSTVIIVFACTFISTIYSDQLTKVNKNNEFNTLFNIMVWMLWIRLIPLILLSLTCFIIFLTTSGLFIWLKIDTRRRI